jgi:hypothetical protein
MFDDNLAVMAETSELGHVVYHISSIANGSKAEHTPTMSALIDGFDGFALVQMSEIHEKLGHVCNERQEERAPYSHGKPQVNTAPIRFFHARLTGSMPD